MHWGILRVDRFLTKPKSILGDDMIFKKAIAAVAVCTVLGAAPVGASPAPRPVTTSSNDMIGPLLILGAVALIVGAQIASGGASTVVSGKDVNGTDGKPLRGPWSDQGKVLADF